MPQHRVEIFDRDLVFIGGSHLVGAVRDLDAAARVRLRLGHFLIRIAQTLQPARCFICSKEELILKYLTIVAH